MMVIIYIDICKINIFLLKLHNFITYLKKCL